MAGHVVQRLASRESLRVQYEQRYQIIHPGLNLALPLFPPSSPRKYAAGVQQTANDGCTRRWIAVYRIQML